jgi:hypothetical protein
MIHAEYVLFHAAPLRGVACALTVQLLFRWKYSSRMDEILLHSWCF